MNHAPKMPQIVHSEDFKDYEDEYVSIKLIRYEWIDDTHAWTNYDVHFTAECGGLAMFTFDDQDKANQLFNLMVQGVS